MEKASWLADMNPISMGIVCAALLALVVILAVLVKKGILRFKGKGLTIGNDGERTIVRSQVDYCKAQCYSFMSSHKIEENNKYLARYITELVFDELVSAIMYNHISKDNVYITNKVEIIWSIIIKYAKSDCFKSEDFKNKVASEVRETIEHLVDIREYFLEEK